MSNLTTTTQVFTEKEVQTIKDTVAVGATDSELSMFLTIAKQTGLNPFLKEIFFSKYGGRVMMMTSRDGYLKIANLHPDFEGMDSDYVCENDKFSRIKGEVFHEYAAGDRGKIIGAYALVYRKGRMPAYKYVPVHEYYDGKSNVWQRYTSAMITKVAESMALKRAFAISGLVSQEEIPVEQYSSNHDEQPLVQSIDLTPIKQELMAMAEQIIDAEKREIAINFIKKAKTLERLEEFKESLVKTLQEQE